MGSHAAVSSAFIWRRVHSLMGFWLIVYLFEHLLVNSQAALWIGDDGHGFIKMVNSLESLPYLQVIETFLIGFPLLIHMGWGVSRLFQAKSNSWKTDGSSPSLGSYGRNRAYTWQRLTSWILLIGVIAHVVQMRFVERPREVHLEGQKKWEVEIQFDEGLTTLAPRLGVQMPAVQSEPLQPIAVLAPDMGTATLLVVREAFKSPWQSVLYSVFVLAAAFHAFNGFWTFLITWGFLLSYRSQKAMIPFSVIGIGLLSFFGLAAIWGSYLINLRH
ncbi:MAG TPA: succinate dehydrogenase [Parachlamydiales bacterium]|nr:succinate dehydrogenase [Parachlamydiales bacterium]